MTKIQIFSPHIDDAIFSLGGSMLNWRSKGLKVKVFNIFTISNWINPDAISGKISALNTVQITELRKNEERNAAKYAGFDFEFWDFLDFPLRDEFSPQENLNMELEILNKITKCFKKEDSIFFPVGIDHADHILINKISNSFINKGLNIFHYEDLPYYSWGKFDYKKDYMSKKSKIPIIERINFEKKMVALTRYNSQVSDAFIKSIMSYSYNLLDNEYYERYWQLK